MRKILFVLLSLFVTGCASLVGQASGEGGPEEKWQDANISHYRYELGISCVCIFAQDMPLVIEVQDGGYPRSSHTLFKTLPIWILWGQDFSAFE